MSELLLQFIWKFGLFDKESAQTTTGERLEVISAGIQNADAGPDFSNARLKVGSTVWAGNVEVHLRTSDWRRHNHQADKAYDNVILHVVLHNDCEAIHNSSGAAIPVYEMRYNQALTERYGKLMASQDFVPCRPLLQGVENFKLRMLLTRLAVERMEQRCTRIAQLLGDTHNDWEAVFQRTLFRAFGFGINAQPFELLAQSLPAASISKHRSSLLQLEALLLGQAGLLDGAPADEYHVQLQKEYALLRAKFSLTPMEPHLWKYLRMRPVNFPTIRIAQLASLLHTHSDIVGKMLEVKTLDDCQRVFSVKPSEYWDTRYTFGKISAKRNKALGEKSVERIAANFVAPTMFAYGKNRNQERLCSTAIELLEQIAPEQNSKIDGWRSMGVVPQNMLESQALLQLKNEYCDKKKCLQCSIGRQILEE
jgi:hypothetical protein